MECRQSGLSDYQWCKQNGINPVVKVDLVESVIPKVEQNAILPDIPSEGKLAAELQLGNITVRLFNGADAPLCMTNFNQI